MTMTSHHLNPIPPPMTTTTHPRQRMHLGRRHRSLVHRGVLHDHFRIGSVPRMTDMAMIFLARRTRALVSLTGFSLHEEDAMEENRYCGIGYDGCQYIRAG